MTDTKPKVLLLDDDKFLADMYSMKFLSAGYEVQAALSVDGAINIIKGGFIPDVTLFDIVMPGQDGFAYLKRLHDEHLGQNTIKIALTNQSDDAERTHAAELGADRYVVKASMIPSEVVNIVGEELAKKKR